jgi:hypothetical protein
MKMRTALSLLLIASAFLTTSCAPSAPVDNRATEAAPEAKVAAKICNFRLVANPSITHSLTAILAK